MMKGYDIKRNSLPFGTLVIELCLDWGVKVRPKMGVLKPRGDLNKGSFQRSQGHNGGPVARQYVPPVQGTDEVQDALDAEEERKTEQAHAETQVKTRTRWMLQDIMLGNEAKQNEIL